MAAMVKVKVFILLIFFSLMAVLSGCGGAGGSDSGSTTTSTARYLDLIASSTQLNSAGTTTVTLTALVKDANNTAVSGERVTFAATSGSIIVNNATTDNAGQATATLGTGGNQANRTITVRATSGTITSTVDIAVIGTTITISGQDGLAYGTSAEYTITLKDSAGNGISGQAVTVSSPLNTLNATSITTNGSGQVFVTLTARASDTITASAFGTTGTKSISVQTTTFVFTTPASGATVNINTWTNVTVNYTVSSVPQVGVTVSFLPSRGELSASSTTTDAFGNATVQIRSTTVGEATISASIIGTSVQRQIEFVATTPTTIAVQSNPSSISTNAGGATTQQSMITATLRDSANNPVKNKKVNFTIVADASVGSLSPNTATTDSAGAASVYYIAGAASSGDNGVTIRATVDGMPALTRTVSLTVSGVAFFITLGTGNKIYSPNTETYEKRYSVLVTGAGGVAISGAIVTPQVMMVAYLKGFHTWSGNSLIQNTTLATAHPNPVGSPYADPLLPTNYCGNEDFILWPDTTRILNAILDAGEDYNGNDELTPENVASVSSYAITDSNGITSVSIFYPKEFANWVYVRLEVTVRVSGTEGKAHKTFLLPYAVEDYDETSMPPPNPFGMSDTCLNAQ